MEDQGIWGYVAAASPGILALLWQAFKSYAKTSPATWDDEAVEFIKGLAKAVVEDDKKK